MGLFNRLGRMGGRAWNKAGDVLTKDIPGLGGVEVADVLPNTAMQRLGMRATGYKDDPLGFAVNVQAPGVAAAATGGIAAPALFGSNAVGQNLLQQRQQQQAQQMSQPAGAYQQLQGAFPKRDIMQLIASLGLLPPSR